MGAEDEEPYSPPAGTATGGIFFCINSKGQPI